MARPKPTIVVVHCAWHTPSHYSGLLEALHGAGYEAICPHLPTCNDAAPPTATLADDVDLIRSTVTQLRGESKEVVALCHSYGGVVGTQALYGLGVKRLIYMSAFVPRRGEGLAGIFGGKLPPWIYRKNNGTLGVRNPEVHLYNDVVDCAAWIRNMVTHPASAQEDPVTSEAWRTAPVSYIVCERDQALPPAMQMMMVGRVQEEGVEVSVETCPTGHLPSLSAPRYVVALVERILR